MAQIAPSSDNLLLGKGELFFARKVGGALGGYRHMGNVETFELTTADEVLEKYSSMSAAAALYKRVTRRRDVTLRVTADEFTPENLSLMMMGDVVQGAAVAATPVTAEELTDDALLGGYYKLGGAGPYTGITITAGGSPLVLGTDYTIHNPTAGVIHILPSATNVESGDTITAAYTPTAYPDGLTHVRGGTSTLVEGAVMFIPDPTTGPKMMVEVWSVSVTPDGAIGLISDEFAQMSMSMAVQEDAIGHPDAPLYRVTYLPA